MKQAIAFSRGRVILPEATGKATPESQRAAVTCAAELARVGYVVDMATIERLARLSTMAQRAWTTEITSFIREKLGGKRGYKPFYVNFPDDVMAMDELELFINAIIHYWSDGTWEPDQVLVARGPLREEIEMSKLALIEEDEFLKIFTELCSANQSMTEFNKNALKWFVETYPRSKLVVHDVPFKETMALLATLGVDVPVKNETDVLRIAFAMSGLDTAILPLPQTKTFKLRYSREQTINPQKERDEQKLRKFSRGERRYLLNLLEQTNPKAENMQTTTRLGRWLRLGEILHPQEHAKQFPKSAAAFGALRNQPTGKKQLVALYERKKVRTFTSNLNYVSRNGNVEAIVDVLKSRPGEFARRMDYMLRTYSPKADVVMTAFASVAHKVSSKVLLEMYEHIHHRGEEEMVRAIQAKGSRSAKVLETLPPLDQKVVRVALNTIQAEILAQLGEKLPAMGKVYLDEQLKDLSLLRGARTQGEAVKTFSRGSRIPFPEGCNVLRTFVHWQDDTGHEDLDLSSSFLDKNGKSLEHVSFTHLKTNYARHSGDVRHRRGSCAEYVDIDLEAIKSRHPSIAYVTMEVYNFNGRPLNSVKDCFCGFMTRKEMSSGEIFEPKTVKNAMVPSSTGTSTLVFVFDLKEKKTIFADLDAGNSRYVEQSKLGDLIKYSIKKPAISVYDLLLLHVQGRGGELVDNEKEADEVFSYDLLSTNHEKLAGLATW